MAGGRGRPSRQSAAVSLSLIHIFAAVRTTGGTGASLYVSTGQGALAANSVVLLIDTAGYNTAINVPSSAGTTLFTAPAGSLPGVKEFAR